MPEGDYTDGRFTVRVEDQGSSPYPGLNSGYDPSGTFRG